MSWLSNLTGKAAGVLQGRWDAGRAAEEAAAERAGQADCEGIVSPAEAAASWDDPLPGDETEVRDSGGPEETGTLWPSPQARLAAEVAAELDALDGPEASW